MNLKQALAGRRVFLTGHTGFKGSWLALWLHELGAIVTGYALPPNTMPSLFALAGVADGLAANHFADINDLPALQAALQAAQPELVLHLAAQPLVRLSYREPVQTWQTNVMGTVHLLEAARACPSVRAVLVVTTDKCYDNREWHWGYRENDPLGGHDPYSASKAGSELVVQSYRKSFFQQAGIALASARAGNVIGGGDWSEDRLIPDAARAAAAGQSLLIRSPQATRPWQHVLESLHGYLKLSARLLEDPSQAAQFAEAFNFGPDSSGNVAVAEVLQGLQQHWPELQWSLDPAASQAPHEARFLYLDSAKARTMLDWQPVWGLQAALTNTASWYRQVQLDASCARALSLQQLRQFVHEAEKR